MLLLGQFGKNVALFVFAAALDRLLCTEQLVNRRTQRFRAIDDEKIFLFGAQAVIAQPYQQTLYCGRVLSGSWLEA